MKVNWRRIILGIMLFGALGAFFVSSAFAVQIKRVQKGVANFDTDDVVQSVPIAAVNMDNSIILLQNTATSTNANDQNWFFTAQFESADTIAIDRAGANLPASVIWQVVEFNDGVSIQRGISSITSPTLVKNITLPVSLTNNGTTAVPIIQMRTALTTNTQAHEHFLVPNLTSNSTLRLDRGAATGTKATQIVWQVVDFLTDATVETNQTIMTTGSNTTNQTVNVTLNTPASNPLFFMYFAGDTATNGIDSALWVGGNFTSATQVQFFRHLANTTMNSTVRFYVVNLTDPVSYAQSGMTPWSTTGGISVSSTSNATPIVVTTSATHGYSTGDRVNIAGEAAAGNGAANGNWIIQNLSNTTFSLLREDLSNSVGSGTSSGTIVAQKGNYTAINPVRGKSTVVVSSIAATIPGVNNVRSADDLQLAAELLNNTTVSTIRGANNNYVSSRIYWNALEFCPFTVKVPNGGEVWRVGQTKNITWKYADDAAADTVQLLLNTTNSTAINGYYALVINNSISASLNNGSYAWTINESIGTTNLIGVNARIAINDTSLSARNYDYSNNRFEIKGDINLTAPNGGENWEVGDTRQINWTRYGNMSNNPFNITISTNGGGNWNNFALVNQSDVGCQGAGNVNCVYSWVVGDNDPTGTNMKVNVSWMGDQGNVSDASSSSFGVRAKITLTQPTASANWLSQDNGTINWTKNGTWPGNNVSLYYRVGAGAEQNITSGENASNGTYAWVNINSTAISNNNTYIVIRSGADPSNVYNISPSFNVSPYVEVTYPNATGIIWNVSESKEITWNTWNGTGALSKVDIWYNNTSGWDRLASGVNATNGTWTWSNILASRVSETVTIRVAKNDTGPSPIIPYDDSSVIAIRGKLNITRPLDSANTVFRVNDSEAVNWTADGFGAGDQVRIKFAPDGNFSNTTYLIGENIPATNNGTLWASVNDTITSIGKVLIEWQTNTTVKDISDVCSVKGKLNLTSPNSGIFNVTENMTINWTPTGSIGVVKLNYTADGGDDGYNHSILNDTGGTEFSSSGPYNWSIPLSVDLGPAIRIKAYAKSDEGVNDTSDNNISIRGFLNLTYPVGWEIWQVGTAKAINWTRQGTKLGNITLKYSTDNGTNYNDTIIASNDSASGSYTWPSVANVMSGSGGLKFDKVKIKVSAVNDANVSDASDNPFTVVPLISITRPDESNNTFYVDDTENITWSWNGSINTINVYSTNATGAWIQQEINIVNNGTHPWYVPNVISNTSRVKVCNYLYNESIAEACGFSINFTRKQKIDINNPATGAALKAGQPYQISWTRHGTLTTANISYANQSSGWIFTEFVNNTDSVNATNYFNWTVPNDMGANTSKIKITAPFAPYSDISSTSGLFSIIGYLNLTQPVTGANLAIKSDTPVRWTYNGSKIGDVKLEYSTDGGINWTVIENTIPVANGSSYNWTSDKPWPTSTSASGKIRVIDVNNSASNSSSGVINFTSSLKLTSHNDGADVTVGSTEYIYWTQYAAGVTNVSYSADGGGNWTLIQSILPNQTFMTTTWNVSNATPVSNNCLIKVEDRASIPGIIVSDTSNNTFAILPVFNMTSPVSGQGLIANDSYNISWTKQGLGLTNVTLEYSTDNGGNWSYVNANTPITDGQVNQSYLWPDVPGNALSTQCKMRVAYPLNTNATNLSSGWYLRGNVSVSAPNGGDSWQIYDTKAINWTKKGNVGTVAIDYSHNNGGNWTTLASGINASNLTWDWTIANTTNTTNLQGLIRITGSDNANDVDSSNSGFTVRGSLNLTAPDASGIVLSYNGSSTYQINWTMAGSIANVTLKYATDGANFTNTIANVTASNQTYLWSIPNSIGANLKVRAEDKDDSAVNDTSSNPFAIKGTVVLGRPNGAENFTVHSYENITWTPTGTYSGTATLSYKNSTGGNWIEVISGLSPGAHNALQTYNWTDVANDVTANATFKVDIITGNATINVNDTSDAESRIRGNLTVSQPNTATQWYYNQSKEIRWNSVGSFPANITYSLNNTSGPWYVINNTLTSADSLNIYNWTVPDKNSEQCLIRVTDNRSVFSYVTDSSDVVFAIRPLISLTQPVSGQNMVVNSNSTPIRWTYAGTTITTVDIQYSLDGITNWTVIDSGVAVANGSSYVWSQVPGIKTTGAKIKVFDSYNANVTNTSGSFNIVGDLRVLSPNGGENWKAGELKFVTWYSSQVSSVQPYYSLNNGTNWTEIGGPVSAGTGGVNWTISNNTQVSNNALFKVEDISNPGVVYDTSNSTFAVIGYLDITAPENGVPVLAEDQYNITWNTKGTGVDNVVLQYRTNDNSSWINVKNASNSSETAPNLGYYLWPSVSGNVLSNYCKIRVYDPNNLNTSSEGANYFPLRGSIQVGAPNGNEMWGVGTNQNISWTKKGNLSSVDIRYSYDNGSSYNTTLASGVTAGNLSWTWAIGNATTLATQAKIMIQDVNDPVNVFDVSNTTFEVRGRIVVDTPTAANITLKINDPYNITWTNFGAIQFVNISYSTNGLNPPWVPVISNLSATPTTYGWTVPDAIGNTLRIRVADANNPNVVNYSANDFRIIGKVDVTKPDNSEPDWVVLGSALIKWVPTGNFTSVKIEGSTNGFSNENQTWLIDTVSAGPSGQEQTYNYSSIGDKISSNVKIRISDADRPADVYNMSTNPFKIKGRLSVISPNAGSEVWTAGTQPTATPIQWQRIGSIANIKIEYSPNTGTNWYEIINSTDASVGVFSNWTVPDSAVRPITPQAYIRITDLAEASVNDTSNNTFLIKGAYNLTAPSAVGQALLVNNTYNVTWTKTGMYDPDNVMIQYSKNDAAYQSMYNVINQSADSVPASQGYFSWYVPDDLSSNIKVKITRNADTVNILPIISPQIKIVGSLLVTPSPPSGARWEVNRTYPIQWSRQGSISNVTLRYSQDGQNYTFIDYASGSSGGVGYNWLIPNTPGIASTNVTIKVSDTSDPTTVYNVSPVFSIVPRFVLTSPALNQKVNASQNTAITWNSFGWNPAVNIYYSTNNFTGGAGTVLIQANATNNGSYSWAVPDVLTNSVKVRVTYPSDESAYNDSDVFRIIPAYEVVSPYSSSYDKWQAGRMHQIKWNCTSVNAPKVKIYYSINSGASYPYQIDDNVSNAGAVNATRIYNWSVNDTITSGFRVRVQDADSGRLDVTADSPFNSKIMGYLNVTYPDGNETFSVNDTFNITWDKSGTVPLVKLEISKNDFNASTVINGSTDNDGIYSWVIPDLISSNVRVRVMDVNDTDAYSISQNYFKIKGSFNVSSPANGERLPIGYNTTLRWNTTGNISRVKIVAYSSLGANDTRFGYTAASPYTINADYNSNVGNGQTNYTWMVPDNATTYARIRVVDYNDSTVLADSSGNFSLIGSFNVTSPNGGQAWTVGATQNITWAPTGSSILEAKISYSVNGTGGPWYNITDTWNNTTDGIVNNSGTYPWMVPNVITPNATAYIRIEDPYDSSVNDTSDAGFKIRGGFAISSPAGSERWVTYENKTVSWNTTGSIGKVNILYSRDNFTTNNTAVSNLTCSQGASSYNWIIPDPLAVYGINSSSLPVSVKVRVVDANDSSVYADSSAFSMDYYSTTWHLRDFLSSLPIAGGLSVNDTTGWLQSGLASPVTHKSSYGSWDTSWTHTDYGDASYRLLADRDQNVTMYLESKVVHVWEARTEFVYDTGIDRLNFKGYLIRDGSIAGSRDSNGTFNTLATSCTIEIYDASGNEIKNITIANVTSAGFFNLEWNSTGLNASLAYNAINQINTSLGGKFRTPFSINLAPISALYNAANLITSRIDVPLTSFQANMTLQMTNQTNLMANKLDSQTSIINTSMADQKQLITTKMNEQVGIIQNKTAEMQTSVNQTLSSFESRTYKAIGDLQVGANQTINASLQALNATDKLEYTAKKYSWAVSVSPNPVLVGDTVTLTCQGEPSLLPLLTIYSWDNKYIMRDQFLTEKSPSLYETSFKADSRFTPGKSYTYVVSESKTGGLVAGSGVVEALSITTIAGLAAAAPEAERAAKKALDAIKAVEAMMTSGGEGTNIALALKNLKSSVDSIPDVIAKEGPAAKINKTVEDISSRIKALFGEQGYDISAIFEEILSESPTLKDIRGKTDEITSASDIMLEIVERKLGGREEPFVSVSLF